jgi:hypothetical protein
VSLSTLKEEEEIEGLTLQEMLVNTQRVNSTKNKPKAKSTYHSKIMSPEEFNKYTQLLLQFKLRGIYQLIVKLIKEMKKINRNCFEIYAANIDFGVVKQSNYSIHFLKEMLN